MKKGMLLKTLVCIAPLACGVLPLASCTMQTYKTANKITKAGLGLECCDIKVASVESQKVKPEGPLFYGEGQKTNEDITLYCVDDNYTVSNIEKIVVHSQDGSDTEIQKFKDYQLKGWDDDSELEIRFNQNFLTKTLPDLKPAYITIYPEAVAKKFFKVRSSSLYVGLQQNYKKFGDTTEINLYIHDGTNRIFDDNDFDAQAKLFIGDNEVSTACREFKIIEGTERLQAKLTFTPDFDWRLYSEYDSISIATPTKPLYEPGDHDANIQMFSKNFTTIEKCIKQGGYAFSVAMPGYIHGKKITAAKWRFTDEEASQERDCKIEYKDSQVEIGNIDQEPINDSIIIDIKDVQPIEKAIEGETEGVGTFEQDSWENLSFWSDFVPADASDTVKSDFYKAIYDLGADEDFVGKYKVVEWRGVKHKVIVASTFQLPLALTDETILEDDDIDFEHHAAFTLQFVNELTTKDGVLTKVFNSENAFFQNDDNRNCWEYWEADRIERYSSKMRKFMNDSGSGCFDYSINDEFLKDMVVRTANQHWTSSTQGYEEEYVGDRYFVPTAGQLNAKFDWDWMRLEPDVEPFEYYQGKDKTNDAEPLRVYTPVGKKVKDAIAYWLATPTEAGGGVGKIEEDIVVWEDGSLHHTNMNNKRAVIPCFSIL